MTKPGLATEAEAIRPGSATREAIADAIVMGGTPNRFAMRRATLDA